MNRKVTEKVGPSPPDGPTVGEMMRRYREALNISQEELAIAAGTTARTISKIENDDDYSGRTLARIVNALSDLRQRDGLPRLRIHPENGLTTLRPVSRSWLEFPDRLWLSRIHGPGALLTADYHVVPFHGARSFAERHRLIEWCQQPDERAIRIYKGEGGMGKTRLAIELCQHLAKLAKQPWTCGFAQVERFPRKAVPWKLLPDLRRPLLVVVDYAGDEEKTWLVSRLLGHLQDCPAPKLRLVFLERDELWLDRLHRKPRARDILLGPLLSRPTGHDVFTLAPVASTYAERVDSFRLAAKAFGVKLALKAPREPHVDLKGALYERVLFIHIQALLAVTGTPVTGQSAIMRHLLAREREYWQRMLDALGLSAVLLPSIEEAVFKISLINGISDLTSARNILRQIESLRDQPEAVRRQVLMLLRECYPQGEKGIGPLQPDMLRDYLVSRFADSP